MRTKKYLILTVIFIFTVITPVTALVKDGFNTDNNNPLSRIKSKELLSVQPNQDPVIKSLQDITINISDTLIVIVEADDPDGDALTFSLLEGPDLMYLNKFTSNKAHLVYIPLFNNQAGQYVVTVKVTDSNGGSATESFNLTVVETDNNSIDIIVNYEYTVEAGNLLEFDVGISENNPDYVLKALVHPFGAVFNPEISVFSWIPSVVQQGFNYAVFALYDDSDSQMQFIKSVLVKIDVINNASGTAVPHDSTIVVPQDNDGTVPQDTNVTVPPDNDVTIPPDTVVIIPQDTGTNNTPADTTGLLKAMNINATVSGFETFQTGREKILGAYIDGNCCGTSYTEFIQEDNSCNFEMKIFSKSISAGRIITFKLFDRDDGSLYDINETIIFVQDDHKTCNLTLKPNTASGITESPNVPVISKEYRLFNNYPNPFNPETTIKFSTEKSSYVKLMIYSITGSLVKTLHSGNLPGSTYTFKWNGTDNFGRKVASGIYIYRLTVGSQTTAKKMFMIK